MTIKELQEEIVKLKKKNDVTFLAHYYQPLEIQAIADHLGDSLGLSKIARDEAESEYILFAGVVFMAETASILNQDKHVIVPAPDACCPMAAYLNPSQVSSFKNNHPGLPVVTYVNSTAATKAESDVCCTSSNAVTIVKAISKEFKTDAVLFGPDSNLATYAEEISGITCLKLPEDGHCYVHSDLTAGMVKSKKDQHPDAEVLVHPECKKEVRELADVIGSTAQMYNHVQNTGSEGNEYLIGTEEGLLRRMAEDFPNNKYFLISEDLICKDMKKNTLELIKLALEHPDDQRFEIKVPSSIAKRAIKPIEKMLQLS